MDFEKFCVNSGLKLNKDKTKMLPLGCNNLSFNFGQKVEVLKILGVYLTLNEDLKEKINFKEILSKIKKILNWWKQRDLTLMGKNQLLKTFIYSKLIYVASLIPVPLWVYEELEKLVSDFFWRGRPKIQKSIMYLNYKGGGLKMMHFPTLIEAQRLMWVRRLFQDPGDMKWKHYFEEATKQIGGKLIFSCNYAIGLLNIFLADFYIDLLGIWSKTREFRGRLDYKGIFYFIF